MRLNRPVAILLALVTLAPWGYFVYFFTRVMSSFPQLAGPNAPPDQFFQDFDRLFRLHMLVMALVLALLAFYIVHLFLTPRVPSDKKALWAVVLFLGNLLAMPVYWYLYIWPARTEGAA